MITSHLRTPFYCFSLNRSPSPAVCGPWLNRLPHVAIYWCLEGFEHGGGFVTKIVTKRHFSVLGSQPFRHFLHCLGAGHGAILGALSSTLVHWNHAVPVAPKKYS